MATSTIKKLEDFRNEINKEGTLANAANRQVGGRTILPGDYEISANPDCKITESSINGSDPFYTVELKTTEGKWISVNSLLKKRIVDGSLQFVNPWVSQYGDIFEVATAISNHTLQVGNKAVDTASNFYDGKMQDKPKVNGKAYPASISDSLLEPDVDEQ